MSAYNCFFKLFRSKAPLLNCSFCLISFKITIKNLFHKNIFLLNMFSFDAFSVCYSLGQSVKGVTFLILKTFSRFPVILSIQLFVWHPIFLLVCLFPYLSFTSLLWTVCPCFFNVYCGIRYFADIICFIRIFYNDNNTVTENQIYIYRLLFKFKQRRKTF